MDATDGLQELLQRLSSSLDTIKQIEPEEMGLLAIYLKRVLAMFMGKRKHAGVQELPMKAGEGSIMFSNVERAIKKEIAVMKKEAMREGKLEGKMEGKLEGKLESARAIAARLIQKGMSSKEVSELTDMPLEDVMELMPRQN